MQESLAPYASVEMVNYLDVPWFVGLQVIVSVKPGVHRDALLKHDIWPEGIKTVNFQTCLETRQSVIIKVQKFLEK